MTANINKFKVNDYVLIKQIFLGLPNEKNIIGKIIELESNFWIRLILVNGAHSGTIVIKNDNDLALKIPLNKQIVELLYGV